MAKIKALQMKQKEWKAKGTHWSTKEIKQSKSNNRTAAGDPIKQKNTD